MWLKSPGNNILRWEKGFLLCVPVALEGWIVWLSKQAQVGFYVLYAQIPGVITPFSTVVNIVSITEALDKTTEGAKLAWTHNVKLEIQLEIKQTKKI